MNEKTRRGEARRGEATWFPHVVDETNPFLLKLIRCARLCLLLLVLCAFVRLFVRLFVFVCVCMMNFFVCFLADWLSE